MAMAKVFGTSVFVALLCVFVSFARSVSYNDLEGMVIKCPARVRCTGRRETRPFYQRRCECDSDCQKYRDCCFNAQKRSSSQRTPLTNVMCLQYGQYTHNGIYVVSKCSSSWTGPREVKQRCEGSTDFSDPISAAPVTSGAVTYKNLHCAQCNNADMNSLKNFRFFFSCQGLQGMSEEQIMAQIFFKKERNAWGVNRVDAGGNLDFYSCVILFELPDYLKKNVRFCRANVISTCPNDWTRHQVKKSCEEYMAVVYTKTKAYRNPHCAICNHVTLSQMDCYQINSGRARPFSFTMFLDDSHLDLNENNNKIPSCPAKEIYDPYFKTCRKLSCAIPGLVIRNGTCVPGS